MAVSGKRHLFLTGGRGAGKTTLLKALLPLLCPEPVPGVCTRAIRGEGVARGLFQSIFQYEAFWFFCRGYLILIFFPDFIRNILPMFL